MPLTGIFTRLPTSVFEKFHYQTFFLQWRIILPIFLILVTSLILTLCYVSSLTINIKNIYSHSIFLIFQFLTFSVCLEMQNYKFYLTNSLVQTLYFSTTQPTHTLWSRYPWIIEKLFYLHCNISNTFPFRSLDTDLKQ